MNRSEKKGFRRHLPLLLLALTLLLAAAFVLLLPQIKKAFPAKVIVPQTYAPTYQTVAERDPDTLETITITHRGEAPYTLVNQDGFLSLVTDTGDLEPIRTTVSDNMIRYATTIYVEDTLASDASEMQTAIPDMGLEPPLITATAAFTDGSEVTIRLGSTMLDTAYHYYMWSGDNALYICNSGVYETFAYTAEMLRALTQPPITASLVERVSIQPRDGNPIICALETGTDGVVDGMLVSPYTYPMKPAAARALLNAVESFRLGALLQPLTDENAAQYGLDFPQTIVAIDQRGGQYSQIDGSGALQSVSLEPSTITLTLGDADGEYFRYCAYDGTCYRVSAFLVSAFLQADAAAYAQTNPADLGGAALQGIAVQVDGGTLSIHASYLETVLPNNELETDEYGNVVYRTEVTCNGEPVTADAFLALTARLGQMSVSGMLPSAAAPIGTPLWRMTLETTQGKTRRLAAYPMDSFSDILAVDGVAVHFISKEALEIALGEFSALLKPAEIR